MSCAWSFLITRPANTSTTVILHHYSPNSYSLVLQLTGIQLLDRTCIQCQVVFQLFTRIHVYRTKVKCQIFAKLIRKELTWRCRFSSLMRLATLHSVIQQKSVVGMVSPTVKRVAFHSTCTLCSSSSRVKAWLHGESFGSSNSAVSERASERGY